MRRELYLVVFIIFSYSIQATCGNEYLSRKPFISFLAELRDAGMSHQEMITLGLRPLELVNKSVDIHPFEQRVMIEKYLSSIVKDHDDLTENLGKGISNYFFNHRKASSKKEVFYIGARSEEGFYFVRNKHRQRRVEIRTPDSENSIFFDDQLLDPLSLIMTNITGVRLEAEKIWESAGYELYFIVTHKRILQ